jgi:hypothetical protein
LDFGTAAAKVAASRARAPLLVDAMKAAATDDADRTVRGHRRKVGCHGRHGAARDAETARGIANAALLKRPKNERD